MKLIAIAAVSLDGVIGIDNDIPWRIPEDFQHFRNTTMGNLLIVGATTFKTLPPKAHEGREFMILNSGERITTTGNAIDYYQFSELKTVLHSLNDENLTDKNVYVIGGASIYEQMIDYCDEAVITWVDKFIPEGNKRFPIMKLLKEFECINTANWETSKTGERYKIRYYKRQNDGKGETEKE